MRESLGDRLPLPLCEPPAIERSIANMKRGSPLRTFHFPLQASCCQTAAYIHANLRICILHSKHNHLSTGHSASTRRSLYSIETPYGLASAPIARTSSRNIASSARVRNKCNRHRLYELMQHLQILDRPCNSISMPLQRNIHVDCCSN